VPGRVRPKGLDRDSMPRWRVAAHEGWYLPALLRSLLEDRVDLSLSTRTEGDRTVVTVGGEIDVYTAPKLREQLIDLVSSGNYHLVVDMESVDFLDSTGLGVLVGGLKRVRAHDGSLRLVCTQERILKIFRITGLTKVFPIHASVDEAVSATD
jgi:anti-sigma B factor antagonist